MNHSEKFTPKQMAEACRRQNALAQLRDLQAEGKTLTEAARIIGVPVPTLCRWRGMAGLGENFTKLIPGKSTGRPSAATKLESQLGAEAFKQVVATVKGHNLDMKTNGGAWRYVTATQPVPEAVKAVIDDPDKRSKHYIPRSLTTATKVSRAVKLGFQGSRALALLGTSTPRYIDVLPGDIFVPDDTTPIWGWWVPWPKSKQYPFGKKLLQGQLLLMVDYASLYRIGFSMIAREHSSYRAADVWAFYGDMFDGVGLPRLGMQHEGGVWQANLLRGQAVEYQPDEVPVERRVGAFNLLRTKLLPFHYEGAKGGPLPETMRIYRSRKCKSKPIEMVFNMSQKTEGLLWGSLGRDQRRAPNEKALKIFEACKRNSADPGLHFYSWTELAEELAKLIKYQNHDRMEGKNYQGKPVDLWCSSMKEHGELELLPEELRWVYRRDWAVRTVAGAYVDVSYKDEAGRRVKVIYHNAELFADMDGAKVLVYFDKQKPERAAEIVSLKNERLGQAEHWVGTGGFIDRNEEGFEIESRWRSTVMALTRVTAEHAPSRQVPPEIKLRREEARSESQIKPVVAELPPARASTARSRTDLLYSGMTPEEKGG